MLNALSNAQLDHQDFQESMVFQDFLDHLELMVFQESEYQELMELTENLAHKVFKDYRVHQA